MKDIHTYLNTHVHMYVHIFTHTPTFGVLQRGNTRRMNGMLPKDSPLVSQTKKYVCIFCIHIYVYVHYIIYTLRNKKKVSDSSSEIHSFLLFTFLVPLLFLLCFVCAFFLSFYFARWGVISSCCVQPHNHQHLIFFCFHPQPPAMPCNTED